MTKYEKAATQIPNLELAKTRVDGLNRGGTYSQGLRLKSIAQFSSNREIENILITYLNTMWDNESVFSAIKHAMVEAIGNQIDELRSDAAKESDMVFGKQHARPKLP